MNVMTFVQNDFGIELLINPVDSNQIAIPLNEYQVQTSVVFPDRTEKEYNTNVSDGKIQIIINQEMTTQRGLHRMYLTLLNGLTRITSKKPIQYEVIRVKQNTINIY